MEGRREGHLAKDYPRKEWKCAMCGRYVLCCRRESDCYEAGDKTSERQTVSGRRSRHNANFWEDREVCISEEDCAFAFSLRIKKKRLMKSVVKYLW